MRRRYVFALRPAGEIEVEAESEADARRKAMIARWGSAPDKIVPHAPDYEGLGLILVLVD